MNGHPFLHDFPVEIWIPIYHLHRRTAFLNVRRCKGCCGLHRVWVTLGFPCDSHKWFSRAEVTCNVRSQILRSTLTVEIVAEHTAALTSCRKCHLHLPPFISIYSGHRVTHMWSPMNACVTPGTMWSKGCSLLLLNSLTSDARLCTT